MAGAFPVGSRGGFFSETGFGTPGPWSPVPGMVTWTPPGVIG